MGPFILFGLPLLGLLIALGADDDDLDRIPDEDYEEYKKYKQMKEMLSKMSPEEREILRQVLNNQNKPTTTALSTDVIIDL